MSDLEGIPVPDDEIMNQFEPYFDDVSEDEESSEADLVEDDEAESLRVKLSTEDRHDLLEDDLFPEDNGDEGLQRQLATVDGINGQTDGESTKNVDQHLTQDFVENINHDLLTSASPVDDSTHGGSSTEDEGDSDIDDWPRDGKYIFHTSLLLTICICRRLLGKSDPWPKPGGVGNGLGKSGH